MNLAFQQILKATSFVALCLSECASGRLDPSWPSRRTYRRLKDEWQNFDALSECPDKLQTKPMLKSDDFAEKIYKMVFNWSHNQEIVDGYITEDTLDNDLLFDGMPDYVKSEFLYISCKFSTTCNDFSELYQFEVVSIPIGNIGNNGAKVARNLCSAVALSFDEVLADIMEFAISETSAPTLQPTSMPSPQPHSLTPEPSSEPEEISEGTIVSEDTQTYENMENDEIQNNLPSSVEENILVSFSFGIRVEGYPSREDILSLSFEIEDEVERKTLMGLNENRRLQFVDLRRTLLELLECKVTSFEEIECNPVGNDVTCFDVNADVLIRTKGEKPEDVISTVKSALEQGETEGSYFARLPGLTGIEYAEAFTLNSPDYNRDSNGSVSKIIIILLYVIGGIVCAFLVLIFARVWIIRKKKYRRKVIDAEHSRCAQDLSIDKKNEQSRSLVIFDTNSTQNNYALDLGTSRVSVLDNKSKDVGYMSSLANPNTIEGKRTGANHSSDANETEKISFDSKSESDISSLCDNRAYQSTGNDDGKNGYGWNDYKKVPSPIRNTLRSVFGAFTTCDHVNTNNNIEVKELPSPSGKQNVELILTRPGNDPIMGEKSSESKKVEVEKPTTPNKRSLLDYDSSSLTSGSSKKSKSWRSKIGLKKNLSLEHKNLLQKNTTTSSGGSECDDPLTPWKRKFNKLKDSKKRDDVRKESLRKSGGKGANREKESSKVEQTEVSKSGAWKAAYDKNSGNVYYYNTVTKVTTWKKPQEFDDNASNNDEEAALNGHPKMKATKKKHKQKNNILVEFNASDVEKPKISAKMQQIADLLEKLSPDEPEANDAIMRQYEGREDELIIQLEELVGQAPFDEPSAASLDSISASEDEYIKSSSIKYSKQRVVTPNATSLTKRTLSKNSGFASKTSRWSNSTTRINNTSKQKLYPQPSQIVSHADASSLSSASESRQLQIVQSYDDDLGGLSQDPSKKSLARVDEIFEEPNKGGQRNRGLKAEIYGGKGYGLTSEKYNRSSRRKRQSRGRRKKKAQSTEMEPDEIYSADDSVSISNSSAISDLSTPTALNDPNRERGRAKVKLRKAIKNKDWANASSYAASLRSSGGVMQSDSEMSSMSESRRRRPLPNPQEWVQSDLDRFIAENDWDSVFRYVAVMNKKSPHVVDDKGRMRQRRNNSQGGIKLGARSQLQHDNIPISRVVSDSASETDYDEFDNHTNEFSAERRRVV